MSGADVDLECLRSVAQSSREMMRKAIGIVRLVESGEKDRRILATALEYLELADRQLKAELDRLARRGAPDDAP